MAAKIADRFTLARYSTAADLLANDYDVAFIHSLDHGVPRLTLLAVESGAAGEYFSRSRELRDQSRSSSWQRILPREWLSSKLGGRCIIPRSGTT